MIGQSPVDGGDRFKYEIIPAPMNPFAAPDPDNDEPEEEEEPEVDIEGEEEPEPNTEEEKIAVNPPLFVEKDALEVRGEATFESELEDLFKEYYIALLDSYEGELEGMAFTEQIGITNKAENTYYIKRLEEEKMIEGKMLKGASLMDFDFDNRIKELVTKYMQVAIKQEFNKMSRTLNLPVDEASLEILWQKFVDKKAAYYSDYQETFSGEVLNKLIAAMQEGKSIQEARDDLMSVRTDFTRNKAQTIARTEMTRANKEAGFTFAKEHNDKLLKKWIHTEDGHNPNTRKSHLGMHGKVQGVDESWEVNYSLDNAKYPQVVKETYPGESVYGINCRCNQVYVFKKSKTAEMRKIEQKHNKKMPDIMYGMRNITNKQKADRLQVNDRTIYRWNKIRWNEYED